MGVQIEFSGTAEAQELLRGTVEFVESLQITESDGASPNAEVGSNPDFSAPVVAGIGASLRANPALGDPHPYQGAVLTLDQLGLSLQGVRMPHGTSPCRVSRCSAVGVPPGEGGTPPQGFPPNGPSRQVKRRPFESPFVTQIQHPRTRVLV